MQRNSGRPGQTSKQKEMMKALQEEWEEQAKGHGMSKKRTKKIIRQPVVTQPKRAKPQGIWQGWAWADLDGPPDTQSKPVESAKRANPKVTRPILWRDGSGKYAVVEGPFPEGFFRGGTRSTVDKARRTLPSEMYAHEASTASGWFGMVLTEDVVEVFTGENEFGTVCP